MPALQMGLDRHLNAYHRSAPLLLQFLLADFIRAYEDFQSIQSLIAEEQFNHSLFTLLARFSGPTPKRVKFFDWSPDNGSLYKLYYYAAFITDEAESLGEEFPNLEKSCRKCWMLGTHLLESIEEHNYEELTAATKKLQRCIRQIAKEIVRAITLLRDSENLLYFLLRRRTQLDVIYGAAFTVGLLGSLFPSGLAGAKEFLIERYTARGFDKVADAIRHTFDPLT